MTFAFLWVVLAAATIPASLRANNGCAPFWIAASRRGSRLSV
jgi:hypothetical protein